MNSTLYCIVGPTCRGPNGCVRAPLRYKREALAVHRTSRLTQALATLSLSWEGNTTHSGRRVLRSGVPNHSKSCCVRRVLVCLSQSQLAQSPSSSPSPPSLGIGGCAPPPGCGYPIWIKQKKKEKRKKSYEESNLPSLFECTNK